MAYTIYTASVPVFMRGLRSLASLLEKGRASAEARHFDPEILAGARLAPDMFTLCRQVQIACDIAKNGAARLAGIAPPTMPDTETSLAELQARIAATIAFLETLTQAQFDGADTRVIEIKQQAGDLKFVGDNYLNYFALPNFYFHFTTTYAILRHNGVEIGKLDFLGGIADITTA